ncbi:MAG: hypothetical protein HY006_00115 [Candidatus Sungbacteria bacterium]|nr:hypothetical protein [Candidatus Sungbacteria bacterium]
MQLPTADAAGFSYAVWVPYWRKDKGAAELMNRLQAVQEISPFAYEVKSDGTIVDKLKISQEPWPTLLRAATASSSAKIIPTISWLDGEAIYATLASTSAREAHVSAITTLVRSNGFDGIDIDYEDKKAASNPYFSKFIQQLSTKLRAEKKILSCSIEARTPLASRFVKIPKTIAYANDFAVLGKACDQVRILAYDQGSIDLLLNKQKGGTRLYRPVADTAWAAKVVQEALKKIPARKIMLGTATYGYEYEIMRKKQTYAYRRIKSISYESALQTVQRENAIPIRNNAGELHFTYRTASSTRLVWFNDADSLKDKIKLAKKYKLRGIAIFKIDGESDPEIWSALR